MYDMLILGLNFCFLVYNVLYNILFDNNLKYLFLDYWSLFIFFFFYKIVFNLFNKSNKIIFFVIFMINLK